MKWLEHLKTINRHKKYVMELCFKLGLYKQGLLHDMSKYSPTEFIVGAKYYQGTRSPNNAEREDKGYTSAWLHHKGRNKHHLEYWIDYSLDEGHEMTGMKMPLKYVVEMFCDRVAASKNYRGDAYKDSDAYEYYMKSKDHLLIHPDTAKLLENMLLCLKNNGEEKTLRYIKKQPDLETEEHQRAWLLRVAINLSKDYLKSYWFKNTSELTEDIPIKQDDNKAIWDSVRKLPQKYRIVIELYYKEGYSIKEIADILKKKQATIGTWLSRGKKILEKTLKEDIYG